MQSLSEDFTDTEKALNMMNNLDDMLSQINLNTSGEESNKDEEIGTARGVGDVMTGDQAGILKTSDRAAMEKAK